MVECKECGKPFKRINIFHLRRHDLDERSYLERHPEASIFSDETRSLISSSTKVAMAQEDVRKKFMEGIAKRDPVELRERFVRSTQTEESKARRYTPERAAKISEKRRAWWAKGRKGKTVEELYGEETGKKIRAIKSEQTQGERNPAFGKVYELTGRKVGRYKGQLFRGIFEYSYYKHLESKGIDVSSRDQVIYEPFRIPYEWKGRKRSYTPDFLLPAQRELLEIKPRCRLVPGSFGNDLINAKISAAREHCVKNDLEFKIMTEKDFRVLTYAVAYDDPDVEWLRR